MPWRLLIDVQPPVTPVEQAHELARAFTEHGKRAQLIVYPGAGHGFTYLGAPVGTCCNCHAAITESATGSIVEFMRAL